jgi:hypothetical protein
LSSKTDSQEKISAYAKGVYDANLTIRSNPLVIPKPKRPRKQVGIANGDYLERWLRLKEELKSLFETRDGLVERTRPPAKLVADFPKLGGYQVKFDNIGSKRKENPNPLNVELKTGKLFERCIVSDCGREVSNMWAFCLPPKKSKENPSPAPPRHWHMDEGRRMKMEKPDHFADWIGTLQVVGTDYIVPAADHAGVSELLVSWAGKDDRKRTVADKFVTDVLYAIVGEVKDSTTLQLEAEKNQKEHQMLVDRLNNVVEENFESMDDTVPWERDKEILLRVPIKVVAQLMAVGFAAEEANRGDFWFRKHVLGQSDEDMKRASAYMSATYFILRMHTLATTSQARMSLRT